MSDMLDLNRMTDPNREREGAVPPRRIRRRRNFRYKRAWHPTVNLTAMIDTIFNLLFFFMISSRFGAIEGMLPAKLPVQAAASPTAAVPRTPLRVHLVPDSIKPNICTITIDRFHAHPLPIAQLPSALQKIRREQPGFDADTPVYLMAGDDVAWDHVVNAYNAALTAEYEKIFFSGGS